MFHVPEKFRNAESERRLSRFYVPATGNNGAFVIPCDDPKFFLYIMASDGEGWEHVSVHAWNKKLDRTRTPTWDEMCKIKDAFWDDEDVVMQLHPRKSEYVNMHPNTLHLWRPTNLDIPTPPSIFVGMR